LRLKQANGSFQVGSRAGRKTLAKHPQQVIGFGLGLPFKDLQ